MTTEEPTKQTTPEEEAIEAAWGIIANAGGGDWTKESPEWQEAAARWRDDYYGPYCVRKGAVLAPVPPVETPETPRGKREVFRGNVWVEEEEDAVCKVCEKDPCICEGTKGTQATQGGAEAA